MAAAKGAGAAPHCDFRIRMRSPGDTIGRHDDPNPAIGGVHRPWPPQ
jgi:hypothetical protein